MNMIKSEVRETLKLNDHELLECRRSLLEILRKIEIEVADTEFNQHIKNVYKLLSQLPQDKKSVIF